MSGKPEVQRTFGNKNISTRTMKTGSEKGGHVPGNIRKAYFEADGAGRCTLVSKPFAQSLGYIPENILSANLQDLFTPESFEEFEMFYHVLIRENLSPQTFLVNMICKDHQTKSMELKISVRRCAGEYVVGCTEIGRTAALHTKVHQPLRNHKVHRRAEIKH